MRRVAFVDCLLAPCLGVVRRRAGLCCLVAGVVLALSALSQTGNAGDSGFVIVANARVPVATVDKEFLSRAFLKKIKTWEHDVPIAPADLEPESTVRERFTRSVLGRSVAAVRSYWQQVLFSGRDVPPPEFDDDDAVLRYVISKPGGLGYVSKGHKVPDDGVKVLEIR